jgi:hypothetical protein
VEILLEIDRVLPGFYTGAEAPDARKFASGQQFFEQRRKFRPVGPESIMATQNQ